METFMIGIGVGLLMIVISLYAVMRAVLTVSSTLERIARALERK